MSAKKFGYEVAGHWAGRGSEISEDAGALATGVRAQLDAAKEAGSDPLGGLGASLMEGLATAGPQGRFDEYARNVCGEGI